MSRLMRPKMKLFAVKLRCI